MQGMDALACPNGSPGPSRRLPERSAGLTFRGTPIQWMVTILWLAAMVAACGGTPPRTAPAPLPPASRAGAQAQYEAGLAYFNRREWVAAVEALEDCIELDPRRAYAYYYAGRAYGELDRTALMVERFRTFLRLAPDAPERPAVESVLQGVN